MAQLGEQIPQFIVATSPQGLRRKMLMNNAKYGLFFNYFDIQFVQGKWYAWFLSPIMSDDKAITGQENVDSRGGVNA